MDSTLATPYSYTLAKVQKTLANKINDLALNPCFYRGLFSEKGLDNQLHTLYNHICKVELRSLAYVHHRYPSRVQPPHCAFHDHVRWVYIRSLSR